MAPPIRFKNPKTPVQAPQPLPLPSIWAESRIVLAALFGIIGIALFNFTLNDQEQITFVEFLRGQVGWSGAFASLMFWKLFIGFVLGAAGGYFIGCDIPRAHVAKANRIARVASIFLVTMVIYIPAMTADFLWDDDQEITANPSLTDSFGLWEIWTGGLGNIEKAQSNDPLLVKALRVPLHAIETRVWPDARPANCSADYFPLKTTMLWIEYHLWGRDSQGRPTTQQGYFVRNFQLNGFHVMNIILHGIDALLLFMVLRQLGVPGAWLGSLLFAIYPVHVESVAWIAERKNTLSLFFYLLSISAWIRFEDAWKVEGRLWEKKEGLGSKDYLLALIFFLAALLCKTHVVVLPAVLLLLTWWRNGKLTLRDGVRTAPFFAIALFLAEVTVWFQNGRAIGQEVIPIGDWPSRIAGSGLAVWWYVAKAILPVDLNTIYYHIGPFGAHWPLTDPQWWMFLMGVMVLITLHILWLARHWLGRTPFFVFAYFVGTLFPVLGFFTMSYMRLTLVADHFQYLSDIAVVALMGALVAIGLKKLTPQVRPLLIGFTVVVILACCAYSWERAGIHQSEKTLWTACLAKNDNSWQAHNHLGAVIYMEGRPSEAAPHFERAVYLKPENPEVHNNLGLVLAAANRWEEALVQYRLAVQIKGDVPAMRRNLADALSSRGHFEEAMPHYEQLIKEIGADPTVHMSYGYALAQMHRLTDAQREFELAVQLNPGDPRARQNLEAVRQQIAAKR